MDARGPDLSTAIRAADGSFSASLRSTRGRGHAASDDLFPVGVAAGPGEEAIHSLGFLDGELPM
eukprot:4780513-Alexandrium_andersonii.AAC.1